MTFENYPQQARASNNSRASQNYPGRKLGILALIFSLLNIVAIPTALIGVLIGFIAQSESRRAGHKNLPALIAILVGLFLTLISTIILIIIIGIAWAGFAIF